MYVLSKNNLNALWVPAILHPFEVDLFWRFLQKSLFLVIDSSPTKHSFEKKKQKKIKGNWGQAFENIYNNLNTTQVDFLIELEKFKNFLKWLTLIKTLFLTNLWTFKIIVIYCLSSIFQFILVMFYNLKDKCFSTVSFPINYKTNYQYIEWFTLTNSLINFLNSKFLFYETHTISVVHNFPTFLFVNNIHKPSWRFISFMNVHNHSQSFENVRKCHS